MPQRGQFSTPACFSGQCPTACCLLQARQATGMMFLSTSFSGRGGADERCDVDSDNPSTAGAGESFTRLKVRPTKISDSNFRSCRKRNLLFAGEIWLVKRLREPRCRLLGCSSSTFTTSVSLPLSSSSTSLATFSSWKSVSLSSSPTAATRLLGEDAPGTSRLSEV